MKRVVTTCSLFILSALIIFGTQFYIKNKKPTNENSSMTATYTLKEYNGMIGVFNSTDSTPMRIINIDINSLPDKDKEELKNGVVAENESDLNKRIEDYSS